jgi:hypothetical protein
MGCESALAVRVGRAAILLRLLLPHMVMPLLATARMRRWQASKLLRCCDLAVSTVVLPPVHLRPMLVMASLTGQVRLGKRVGDVVCRLRLTCSSKRGISMGAVQGRS